jgi:Flp pilus assembly protein TadG
MTMSSKMSIATAWRQAARPDGLAVTCISAPEKKRTAQSIWKRRLRDERGQSMVETALVIFAMLLFLIGIMEACMAFYTYHAVAELAHEATRWAIVRGAKCDGFLTDCPASNTDVTSFVQSVGYPIITPSKLLVTTTWPNGGNNPGQLVEVTVSYPYSLSIPFLPTQTFTISSTSEMTIAY